jgi:threonine/homoserine/homoserine lactone efflux protein
VGQSQGVDNDADRLLGALIVALVAGAVNVPSVSVWAAMGTQLRRLLTQPAKLRAFNYGMAALLVGSLYPTIVGH